VTVLDLLGRSVARTSEALPAGRHEVRVDLSGLPAGTYFVRFAQAGRASAALPVTLAVPSSGRPGLTFASGREQAGTAPKAAAGPNDYELRVSADGYTVGPLAVTVQAEMEVTIGMNKVEPNSIGMELVRIPAGTFLMGSESGSSNELPVHQVTLTGDFWLGRYEVTQGEYFAVTGLRPSWFAGDDRLPVEQVSSYDAVAFANALSSAEDLAPCYDGSGNVIGGDPYACEGYRLPTEAEWEYATRAGTTTEYSFGDDSGQLGDYAWHSGNSSSRTHAVGGKLPNPWGLYDVHGNVWEWLHDWYGGSYYDSSPWENPPGPTAGSYRVVRGGSWSTGAYGLRSAYRYNDNPSARSGYGGFRLARAAR
jgi:formylglycine-generating enzyme required for sulfatase activity